VTGIDRRLRQDRYAPGRIGADILADRKQLFDGLNKFIMARGGWITSIAGAPTVTFEVLEHSELPDVIRDDLGYDVVPADPPEGQRLLANAIETAFTTNADGTLAPLTEGSTQPVTTIVRHAGIVQVMRYQFLIP
jgi:hypothetical protein